MNVISTSDITYPPSFSLNNEKEHYLLPATYHSMGFLGLPECHNVTKSGFIGNEVEESTSSFTLLQDVMIGGMFFSETLIRTRVTFS